MWTLVILVVVIVLLIWYCRKEPFGVCDDCDQKPTPITGTLNPMIWPCSGTPFINNKYVWWFSDPNSKPVKTTDQAEALLPKNISGMNVLTVPDQEYLTN